MQERRGTPHTTNPNANDATTSKVSPDPPSTNDKTPTSEVAPILPPKKEELRELRELFERLGASMPTEQWLRELRVERRRNDRKKELLKFNERIRDISPGAALSPPPTEEEPQKLLAEGMRDIMRRVPHPVVVITSGPKKNKGGPDPGDEKTKTMSMTVSSFNTVRLHPTPIVSFNTKIPSSTLDQIIHHRDGYCFVNFLLSNGRAAAVAHEFAGRFGERPRSEMYDALLAEDPEQFRRMMREVVGSKADARRGILARARCRILPDSTVTIGDHRIVVAEVEDVWNAEHRNSMSQPYNLVYVDGKYGVVPGKQTGLPLGLPFGQPAKVIQDLQNGRELPHPENSSNELES